MKASLKKSAEVVYYQHRSQDALSLAISMANDISLALHEQLHHLHIFDGDFARSLTHIIHRLLERIYDKQEPVSIFYEVVPGFTMMAFRKNKKQMIFSISRPVANEAVVVSAIIREYFGKTGFQTMVIENDDVLFVMFPVSNMEKNLYELGFSLNKDDFA